MNSRLLVVELNEEEEIEFKSMRSELVKRKSRLDKIPISANEFDPTEWEKAFAIAGPYAKNIMALFYFYEDGKDFIRSN